MSQSPYPLDFFISDKNTVEEWLMGKFHPFVRTTAFNILQTLNPSVSMQTKTVLSAPERTLEELVNSISSAIDLPERQRRAHIEFTIQQEKKCLVCKLQSDFKAIEEYLTWGGRNFSNFDWGYEMSEQIRIFGEIVLPLEKPFFQKISKYWTGEKSYRTRSWDDRDIRSVIEHFFVNDQEQIRAIQIFMSLFPAFNILKHTWSGFEWTQNNELWQSKPSIEVVMKQIKKYISSSLFRFDKSTRKKIFGFDFQMKQFPLSLGGGRYLYEHQLKLPKPILSSEFGLSELIYSLVVTSFVFGFVSFMVLGLSSNEIFREFRENSLKYIASFSVVWFIIFTLLLSYGFYKEELQGKYKC